MTTSATPHLFWITSRAAGIVALVLASLAVSLGLLMSTKLLRKRGPDLLAFHEVLSISTLVAIAVHGLTLLGDKYMHPSIVDIAVPFASGYKTFWTSLGIIGGWGLALLGLSFYLRRHIGATRWRKLHRLTAVTWLAGLVHAVGEGTDAGQLWFLIMVGLVVTPALLLLVTRYLGVDGRSDVPRPAAGGGLDVRGIRVGTVPTATVAVRRDGTLSTSAHQPAPPGHTGRESDRSGRPSPARATAPPRRRAPRIGDEEIAGPAPATGRLGS
jgi:sulfoxide reductase heme-binding subunit YedZ